MKNQTRQKAIALILAVAFAIALLPAVSANGGFDFESLPFENIVVGNTTCGDCAGKAVVAIFGRSTCGNTAFTMPLIDQFITQNNLQKEVLLLFFDVDRPASDIRAFVKDRGFANVAAFSGGSTAMWEILKSQGMENSVVFPVVVYFSGSGEIAKVTTNISTLADITDGVFAIIGAGFDVMSLPAMAAYPGNLAVREANRRDRVARNHYRDYEADKISASVKSKAEEITSKTKKAYSKILAVHDWVAGNIYYDYDDYYALSQDNRYDSETVLSTKKSTCEGYANLTVDLLRAAGVPAKKVSGYALGSRAAADITEGKTNHSWVEAFAEGRWVILDPTWDSGNEWRNGAKHKSGGMVEGRPYFDPPLEDFSLSHRIDSYHPDDSTIPTAPKIGDPIGDVVYTDIRAYIDGHQIPVSNVGGYVRVVVEDLKHYGFDVVWSAKEGALKVERNKNKAIKSLPEENIPAGKKPGDVKAQYILSSIDVYLSGEWVESDSIGGYMFIDFELLKKYGSVSWDASNRILSCELKR